MIKHTALKIVFEIEEAPIVNPDFSLNTERLDLIARISAQIMNSERDIIIVSAGAIVAGMSILGMQGYPETLAEKQALAAVGQVELIKLYQSVFDEYNQSVAQILMARGIVEKPKRRKNAHNTIDRLLKMRVIPIINENDTTSIADIEQGNNYELTACVADIIEADILIQLCPDFSFDVVSPCKEKVYNVKTKERLYTLLDYLNRHLEPSSERNFFPTSMEELNKLPRKQFEQ